MSFNNQNFENSDNRSESNNQPQGGVNPADLEKYSGSLASEIPGSGYLQQNLNQAYCAKSDSLGTQQSEPYPGYSTEKLHTNTMNLSGKKV